MTALQRFRFVTKGEDFFFFFPAMKIMLTLYFSCFPRTLANENMMVWSFGRSLKASRPISSAWPKLPGEKAGSSVSPVRKINR